MWCTHLFPYGECTYCGRFQHFSISTYIGVCVTTLANSIKEHDFVNICKLTHEKLDD